MALNFFELELFLYSSGLWMKPEGLNEIQIFEAKKICKRLESRWRNTKLDIEHNTRTASCSYEYDKKKLKKNITKIKYYNAQIIRTCLKLLREFYTRKGMLNCLHVHLKVNLLQDLMIILSLKFALFVKISMPVLPLSLVFNEHKFTNFVIFGIFLTS